MFDPRSYREACDELALDTGKIEEMIFMTENTEKKALRRPARVAVVAAALAAALCVTAAAAEVPAGKEFFATVFVTISTNDESAALGLNMPEVAMEEREGRSILVVNDEALDVTDALAKEGGYLYEGDGFEVQVDEKGVAVVTVYGNDGMTVSYSTEGGDAQGGLMYKVAEEDQSLSQGEAVSYNAYQVSVDVEAPEGAEGQGMTTYNIVTDERGEIQISPAGEK